MFDLERLVEQAGQQTGLDDLGADDWREGCERLLDAFETEARLSDVGRVAVDRCQWRRHRAR